MNDLPKRCLGRTAYVYSSTSPRANRNAVLCAGSSQTQELHGFTRLPDYDGRQGVGGFLFKQETAMKTLGCVDPCRLPDGMSLDRDGEQGDRV